MGEPRVTTVDKLDRTDIGHMVRFMPTKGRSNTDFAIEAVLLDFFEDDRNGYRFRLRFYLDHDAVLGRSERDWHGPMKPWQPIEVLGKPGEVSVGERATSDLAGRLDPAQAELLQRLRGQIEN